MDSATERLLEYAGKRRNQVSNPRLTANQAIAVADDIQSLQRERRALQARIDALMLEYCPDEMTPEQIETWENNQIVSLQEVQPNER